MENVKKEVGVKLFVKGQSIPITHPVVSSKFDNEENLIITFGIGKNGQDEVKLIFDKRYYLDIQK